MTDFRAEFKSRRFGFGNVDEIRAIRADTVDVKRKSRRTKYFDEQRNFDSLEAPTPIKQPQRLVDSRRERLLKWKKERDLRNKLKKEQAKPVFKTGIVHHKFYSPLFSQPKPTEKTPRKEPIPKRITRATEKRLAAKAAAAAITEQSKKSSQKKIPNQKKVGKKSFAPEGYKFKAPAGLLQLPLIGTVTPKKRCSGTTEWFVFDEKNSPKEAVDENNRKESEIVRFGRASVQKTRFRNFSIFDLSTPAAKKDVIDDNPKTRSILMTTSKYDGNKNQNGNRIEEDDEEDEKQHSRPRKVKPKVERTPKNKAVHFTPGTKTPKSPSQKKIKIVRVKL